MIVETAYKSTLEEDRYSIFCDRETIELLANWSLVQLRKVINDHEHEPEPEEIGKAFRQWKRLDDVLKE